MAPSEPAAPAVSFLVPTLNRLGHVNRAVRSALESGISGFTIQVVVLDSQSDDGSWESLVEEFGQDKRVVLLQNRRGLGPTRSWRDAAEAATGQYATFLWSDDWVFPDFLEMLIPALSSGAEFSYGAGIVRDVDDSTVPRRDDQTAASLTPIEDVVSAYFVGVSSGGPGAPVSPACAVFSRRALDTWTDTVEEISTASPLRTILLWRRAIGPDLYLFLLALGLPHSGVAVTTSAVTQFSAHKGSITVSTDVWLLRTGYWLVNATAIAQGAVLARVDVRTRRAAYARHLIRGVAYILRSPQTLRSGDIELDRATIRASLRRELGSGLTRARRDVGCLPLAVEMLALAFSALPRVVSRVIASARRRR